MSSSVTSRRVLNRRRTPRRTKQGDRRASHESLTGPRRSAVALLSAEATHECYDIHDIPWSRSAAVKVGFSQPLRQKGGTRLCSSMPFSPNRFSASSMARTTPNPQVTVGLSCQKDEADAYDKYSGNWACGTSMHSNTSPGSCVGTRGITRVLYQSLFLSFPLCPHYHSMHSHWIKEVSEMTDGKEASTSSNTIHQEGEGSTQPPGSGPAPAPGSSSPEPSAQKPESIFRY